MATTICLICVVIALILGRWSQSRVERRMKQDESLFSTPPKTPEKIKKKEAPKPKAQPKEPVKIEKKEDEKFSEADLGAIQLLFLLQKNGRLLDFAEEDLADYSDEDIGAAVRPIHEGLKKTLAEILEKEKVLDTEEGETWRVQDNTRPWAIRLSGKVSDKFPLKGRVLHHGWEAIKVKLPQRSKQGPEVLVPAEVEI